MSEKSIYDVDRGLYETSSQRSIISLEDKFSKGVFSSKYDQYELNIDNIEVDSDSLKIIDTYNDLYRRCYKSYMVCGNVTNLDFSQLINCMAKIFELELNLSIVQWIRSMMGIEMPQYYNKFYADSRSSYIWSNGNFQVNFNQSLGGSKLKHIPIGSSWCYINDFIRNNGDASKLREIKDLKSFANIWDKIKSIRNEASHTNVIGIDDFIRMFTLFNTLVEDGYLVGLMQLKRRMKGN